MKLSLNEQKEKIIKLMPQAKIQLKEGFLNAPTKPNEEDLKNQIQMLVVFELKEGLTADEIKQKINSWIDEEVNGELQSDIDESKKSIEEGNAFVFAAKKAKDEGKNKFEFEGKKYTVQECIKKQ